MTDKPSDTPKDETETDDSAVTPPAEATAEAVSSQGASAKGASTSDAPAKKTPENPPPRKNRPWFLWLVVVLLLGGVGVLGYGYWLQHQSLNQVRADLQQDAEGRGERLAAVSDRIDELRQRLAEQNRTLSQTREANESLDEQVTQLRRQLTEVTATTNDDWKLAEAHYLTRLAGQRLVMERNPEGALALLQAADEILKNRDDPDLYPVRKQLAKDITELKLAAGIDREGIFLALSALGEAVAVLPAPTPSDYRPRQNGESEPELEEPQSTSDKGGAWQKIRRSFANALAGFQDFIRVTHTDRPIPPALSPEARSHLQTSLRLHLESAQWALLREQPLIYRDSLDKAVQLLERFYPLSREAEQLVAQIKALRGREIVQTLPDINQSQKLLGDYLEKRHRLQDNNSSETASGENQP